MFMVLVLVVLVLFWLLFVDSSCVKFNEKSSVDEINEEPLVLSDEVEDEKVQGD